MNWSDSTQEGSVLSLFRSTTCPNDPPPSLGDVHLVGRPDRVSSTRYLPSEEVGRVDPFQIQR